MLVVVLVNGKEKTHKKMTLLSAPIHNPQYRYASCPVRIPHFLPRIFCLPWQPANQCDG
jgi:hypothetical protein